MRTHGVPDFPDPTLSPGGGVGFQMNLNQNSPAYQAAAQACQSRKPGGKQAPQVSSKKLAAEVRWAQCMRTHGVPTFPDPNAQGALDSGDFDPTSSAFPNRQPSLPVTSAGGRDQRGTGTVMTTGAGLAAEAKAAPAGIGGSGPRRRPRWTPLLGVVVMAVAVVAIVVDPFAKTASVTGVADNADPTGLYTGDPSGSVLADRRCRPRSATPAATAW